MASLADGLRQESKRMNGQPAFRRLQGWSFGLSYVDGSCPVDWLEEFRKYGIEHALDPARGPYWVLSAKLVPPGRGSTVADWHFLGQMLAAVRVPDAVVKRVGERMESESIDPNDTHWWVWHEVDDRAVQAKEAN